MADPRDSLVSRQPSIAPLKPEEFDDSIFERAGQPAAEDRRDGDRREEAEAPPGQREGLPPGFRMRHDPHYVDELLSGGRPARSLAIAERATPAESVGEAPAPATPQAYTEVGESLEAIETCLQLFRESARPPAERAALDLIETETARAAWLVQALSVLAEEPPVANGSVDLEAIAVRVAHRLVPGRYHAGSALRVEAGAPGLKARGDESLLTMAVAAMATALQAATERAVGAVVRIHVTDEPGGRVRLEATQDSLRMPASWRARFLDPDWTDRPGGRRVAIGLAAARRVAELHRGALTMGGAEHGGCRLVLSLPRA